MRSSPTIRVTSVPSGHVYVRQHHPVERPPVSHLDDILTNAAVFHERWGWWPMTGWLDAFAEQGLIAYDAHAARWHRAPAAM